MSGSIAQSGRLIAATVALAITATPALAQQSMSATKAPIVAEGAPEASAKLVAAGVARAKAENKRVLVEFGASWCGFCHKFDKFLADPVVGKYMHDNYVVVTLVVLESADKKHLENAGSDTLMAKWVGAPQEGIPYFAILDATGAKIGDSKCLPDGSNVGHPETVPEVNAFDALLAKTAPRMTATQRAEIHAFLDKMAGR